MQDSSSFRDIGEHKSHFALHKGLEGMKSIREKDLKKDQNARLEGKRGEARKRQSKNVKGEGPIYSYSEEVTCARTVHFIYSRESAPVAPQLWCSGYLLNVATVSVKGSPSDQSTLQITPMCLQ